MLHQQIKRTIDNYIIEYNDFMGIDYFPNYELQFKEVSQEQADISGIETPAYTRFLIDIKNTYFALRQIYP